MMQTSIVDEAPWSVPDRLTRTRTIYWPLLLLGCAVQRTPHSSRVAIRFAPLGVRFKGFSSIRPLSGPSGVFTTWCRAYLLCICDSDRSAPALRSAHWLFCHTTTVVLPSSTAQVPTSLFSHRRACPLALPKSSFATLDKACLLCSQPIEDDPVPTLLCATQLLYLHNPHTRSNFFIPPGWESSLGILSPWFS